MHLIPFGEDRKKNHKELSFNFAFNLFSYPPHFFKSICTLIVSQLGSFKFYQPMKLCCRPDRIWRMLTNVLHVSKLFYGSIQNSYKVTAQLFISSTRICTFFLDLVLPRTTLLFVGCQPFQKREFLISTTLLIFNFCLCLGFISASFLFHFTTYIGEWDEGIHSTACSDQIYGNNPRGISL